MTLWRCEITAVGSRQEFAIVAVPLMTQLTYSNTVSSRGPPYDFTQAHTPRNTIVHYTAQYSTLQHKNEKQQEPRQLGTACCCDHADSVAVLHDEHQKDKN